MHLETDDPDNPSRTYTATYRSYPHVRFDESTLDLGPVTAGGHGSSGSGNGKETWLEIFEPASSRVDAPGDLEAPPCLAIELDRVPVVDLYEGGKIVRSRYRVGVRYAPGTSRFDESSGTHSATIVARTRQGRAASITALWSLNLPLQASPGSVSFGLIGAASGPVRKDLTLKALDGHPFRVLSVHGDSASIEPVVEAGTQKGSQAGLSHNLRLIYLSKNSGSRYETGRLTIATDHPEMPKVTIPWSAILRD